MCQYQSTRPQPIQLVSTMQKKLFTLSFQPKFLKIRFTKVAGSRSFLMIQQFFSPHQMFPGVCLSQIVTPLTPKNTHKEWCYHTFVKEWIKALDKTRILAPSDYFYHFLFPSYGRLKSRQCIFEALFINSANALLLTAVLIDTYIVHIHNISRTQDSEDGRV